jgi:hypothetical protein
MHAWSFTLHNLISPDNSPADAKRLESVLEKDNATTKLPAWWLGLPRVLWACAGACECRSLEVFDEVVCEDSICQSRVESCAPDARRVPSGEHSRCNVRPATGQQRLCHALSFILAASAFCATACFVSCVRSSAWFWINARSVTGFRCEKAREIVTTAMSAEATQIVSRNARVRIQAEIPRLVV